MKINIKQDDVSWQRLLMKNVPDLSDSKTKAECSCNGSYSKRQEGKLRGRLSHCGFLSRNLLVTVLFISLINILSLSSVVESHQFSSFQSPRNIRHLPCVARKTGLKGTCMFAIDCLKSNGTHLGTCIDKFYFGSCCQLHAPEEAILQHEINDNSIDNNVVSHFQHYSSPQRPLVPVSTIPAPVSHHRRNVTASIQRVTTPSTTTTKRKHQQNNIRVTTENIRLSTFQVVQEARVTSPSPAPSKINSNAVNTKPTKEPSKSPVKLSSSTTKTTSKAPVTQKVTQKTTTTSKRPLSTTSSTSTKLTTTIAPATTQRRQNTTVNTRPITEKWTTIKRTPPPVIKVETSTFAPLNQKTTTVRTTGFSKVTLPAKTTPYKSTVYKKPPIITGSTLHPVTMPYRNLTNRNPTKPPLAQSTVNKTNGAYTDTKPIYINVTQGTKAPRPKPKPTAEITIIPPTSISHLAQDVEFTTMQYVSSSRITTTVRPVTTTPVLDLIRNSTSYVTNTSFRPTQRPMNSTTHQKATSTSSSTSTTKTTTVRPPLTTTTTKRTTVASTTLKLNTTRVTQRPNSKPVTTTTVPPRTEAISKTTPTTTTTRSTTVRTTHTTKEPSNTRLNYTSTRLTTQKPTHSTSTITRVKPSSISSSVQPNATTEKPNLVTWTVPVDSIKNETKEDLQPVNWILVSSTPSVNQSTTSFSRPTPSTTSKKPIVTETTVTSTRSTTTAPTTTQKTTTTTTRRPTTRSTTTTTKTTKRSTTPSTTTTKKSTVVSTTSKTTKRPPPIINDTGIPVLLIPEEDSSAPSTSGPPLYSTEEIIGTSTSTSIEVKPTATTEQLSASSNIYLENTTMPSGAVTEPSVFEYNATHSSSSSMFTTNTSDFFTPTTPAMPQLEGVDYRQICGKRMFPEPRIVGGAKASFGRWPWQISLRQWRTSTYLHKCGAALLNENWAITAAHCVDNVPPSDLLLRLGEYDLAVEEEPYGYQERRVQIVASHPQFDPRTFEYDLALLRFYEPVIFQPNIIPVCVPDSDENFIGRTAYVTGWGRLYEDGPLPSVLQEVTVPVIKNDICEGMYRAAGYIEHIPHIFICAGWKKGGYDSCEGDSGGPMVIQRHDKRFLLAGVISWGIGCAEPNQPGVYTRISEFRDWINQILQF